MYIATLLTDPRFPALDLMLVESIRNAWGGGEIRWLSNGEAAEFDLPNLPDNLWAVWTSMQGMQIDLAVQPAAQRRKSVLLADMDSTMIEQECIDELAEVAGVGAEVRQVTARAMNGELDFEEALNARLSLMQGLSQSVIDDVLEDRITYASGGATLVATMKAAGGYAALVSGGFTAFTGPVAQHLGFDEHRANVFGIADGKLTGAVDGPILGREAKIEALNRICKDRGVDPSDVIAVGDGANDLGMLGLAGAGVALHAKPAVAEKCDLRINFGDLTALLFLQGYARTDFVTS